MPTCRGRTCRAEIIFAWTGQKPMPVDPEPHPDGNVRLVKVERGVRESWNAEVLGPLELELARADGVELYMPHHATCPDVEDFR